MSPPSCYEKAVQLLASRPHFRAELAGKLARRGFPEEEIGGALDRLTVQGYLDDRRTAHDFVAYRLEREAEGRLRLQAELAKRGAPEEAIEAALAELVPQDDLPAAREAAERWAGRARRPEDAAALARHLARKGFSRRAIFAVLNESHDIEPE